MKRIMYVVAGLVLASFIGACSNNPAPDGQKGRSDFYEDGHETGSSYPYTKPGK